MPTQFDRKALRKLRKRAGLTQEQVARRVGVTQEMICRLEGGHGRPSIETLAKLADLFGVTWSKFSERAAEPTPADHATPGGGVTIMGDSRTMPQQPAARIPDVNTGSMLGTYPSVNPPSPPVCRPVTQGRVVDLTDPVSVEAMLRRLVVLGVLPRRFIHSDDAGPVLAMSEQDMLMVWDAIQECILAAACGLTVPSLGDAPSEAGSYPRAVEPPRTDPASPAPDPNKAPGRASGEAIGEGDGPTSSPSPSSPALPVARCPLPVAAVSEDSP